MATRKQTRARLKVGDRVKVEHYFGSGTTEREYAARHIVFRTGTVNALGLTRERKSQAFVGFKDGRPPLMAWVPLVALVPA